VKEDGATWEHWRWIRGVDQWQKCLGEDAVVMIDFALVTGDAVQGPGRVSWHTPRHSPTSDPESRTRRLAP